MIKNNKIIFSVDVEEWWSVESFSNLKLESNQSESYDRIDNSTDRLLEILNDFDAKGTFFILGRVAQKYPGVVRKIAENGHEIGTHGYAHKLVYNQTPVEFEKDLIKSIKILEEIVHQPIETYRAPSYSITKESLWALEILAKNGIKLDSSIMSARNNRFGIKNAPAYPYEIELPDNSKTISIFPPTTFNILGKSLPASSGFAFRLFPKIMIKEIFKKRLKKNIPPIIVLHNWEIDRNHPKVKVNLKGKLIHYYNINKIEKKLEFFLKRYEFVSFKKYNQYQSIENRFKLNDL